VIFCLNEKEKKNPRNTENEITKKIEIEEKRGERDTLLWEMEIVRCVRSVGFFWTILHDIFNPIRND
jgi:hypothetical protein